MVVLLAVILTAGVTGALIVITTAFELAIAVDAQVALLVSTQVTDWPLVKVLELNVAVLPPTLIPFTFHWYEGVEPPLVMEEVKVILVPKHTLLVEALMEMVGVTFAFTVILMAFDAAILEVLHVALLVSSHVTTSPVFKNVVLKVDALVPALIPFTFHWKAGVVPPLVMVAENKALAPLQILLLGMLIEMVGVTFAFVVMATGFELAILVVTHVNEEVNTQVTTSPLAKVLVIKVEALVPALIPFTFHW